jgi:uncharacterized protein (DUF1015 family)
MQSTQKSIIMNRRTMKQQQANAIIDCGKISDMFEGIILKTTTQSLEKMTKIMLEDNSTKPEKLPVLLEKYKRNMFAPSGKYMFKQYKEGSKYFQDWGADVILYYIVRKVLYNEEIPISRV